MRTLLKHVLLLALMLIASATAQAVELPRRPAFGIAMSNSMPPDVRAAQKLGPNEGVLIVAVQPGLSGANAGLAKGDIVVALDGKPMSSSAEVIAVLRTKRPGDQLKIDYVRNATRATTTATLVPTPLETSADIEVIYDAVASGSSIRRTVITKPKGAGRHPAVLLVGGIGCYPIDNPASENEGYRPLITSLTRQGFVTIRVEKSGIGDSTGTPCSEVNLDTEVEGYTAGLRALKKLSYVDAKRTFIVGHSIGGVVGPLVAAQEPVRGLFVLETVGLTWYEYELINTRRQLKLGGAQPAEIGAAMLVKQWCSHRMLIDRAPRAEILKAKPECAEFMSYPASDAYLQQIAAQNNAGLWAALKGVDVAVLYGAADFVTGVEESKALVDAANAARAGSATYIEIPDMDHFLLQSPNQAAAFQRLQSGGQAPFHPKLGQIVGDWLKSKSN
jgi:uncharacterized protein